jgi:hypothetical protein
VIAVGVGEHDATDRRAECVRPGEDPLDGARRAGVDQGEPVVFGDQVAVEDPSMDDW